jgi:hypothetical protein
MRIYLIALTAVLAASNAFSVEKSAQKEQFYDVSCKLTYVIGKNPISLEKEFQISENATEWTTFLRDSHGVLLLGKFAQKPEHTVAVEFLLIDPSKKEPVVTSPKLISKLGEKSEISVKTHPEPVSIVLKVDKAAHSNLYDYPSAQ